MAKKDRIERDFYPTPPWCVKALMGCIELKSSDVLLEPCRGNGRITNELPAGHQVKWAEIADSVDYLTPGSDLTADVIITNPPFSLALEFIETALSRDLAPDGTMCFLLRLSMLGSKSRADFWREFPWTNLLLLTPRPSFVHGRSDNSEYAWICWDRGSRIKRPVFWTLKKEEVCHD
ncbi:MULTISPECIES: DNA methyltransferase [unclassified Vibrio]|uniref:DNA methyltransferase n=1 Tax=unclassified Vibrio TaxID=2614977 RepID=UPI001361572D|nr:MULTISPECIES: DNA methyltransferase [unclassified Vibrio]NAW60108.1 DNA methyltransferase [Vibrio sp. V36_P2S2PM302]NAX26727.1 DNA methyltransferase [Vibrio sp. V38_P2S17PM301]NAX31820.1 DNA methyltransferase [Vibrio sp. V37_P2S8PM304]